MALLRQRARPYLGYNVPRTLPLATYGSENARRAARAAIEFAAGLSLFRVLVVHVVDTAPRESQLVRAGLDVHALLEEEALTVQPTLALLDEAHVPYTLRAELGDPAGVILGFVEKEAVDLIVLGSRGLSTFSGLVMGSVSLKVVHLAPCPVLIVK